MARIMNGVRELYHLPSCLHTARVLQTFYEKMGAKTTLPLLPLLKPRVLLNNTTLNFLANKLRVGVVRLPSMPTYSLCIRDYSDSPPKVPIVRPISRKLGIGSQTKGSKVSNGTTTSAFIFKEGVILAVEHQRKLSNGSVPNVVILNSHMVGSISGGSEFLLKDLQKKCHQHGLANGRRTSVAEASEWLAETISSRSEEGSSVGVLIAGWEDAGPVLYHVDNKGKIQDCKKILDLFREVHECAVVATGSAGVYARCMLGGMAYYNMSVAEAVPLGKESICVGTWLLLKEGGEIPIGDAVSVYHIGNTGWKRHLSAHDIEDYLKKTMPSHPDYKRDEADKNALFNKLPPLREYYWLEGDEVYSGPVWIC